MILGIDIGTTSIKAVLYNDNLTPIEWGIKEYNLLTPHPDFVEIEPDIYWCSLKSIIDEIRLKLNVDVLEIDGLAISSQGESFIVIDKEGRPLRNIIVWLDSRSKDESTIIKKNFNSNYIYHITGCPEVIPCWLATKLLWIKRNESELFKQIYKILLVEDYFIYKLTGNFAGNGTMYCESLLYDINKNIWWKEMLDFLDIKDSQLPDLHPSGVKVGEVSENASKYLGIKGGGAVVSAGMDQVCTCVGTGNILSGVVTENIGSAINLAITADKPVFDSKRRAPCIPHAIKGKFIYLPWNKTGGMLLKWFRDNFCEEQVKKAKVSKMDSYDFITRNLNEVPLGSNGVVILPHLEGSISPEMDENVRCVFYGVNLSTKREDLVRAILESVSYSIRSIIELIEETGIEVRKIILSGGASKNNLWNQIRADILGKKLIKIKNQDNGCLGAAILASFGVGYFKSIKEACDSVIEVSRIYEPNQKNKLIYDKYYDVYKDIYKRLKPVFKKSAILKNYLKKESYYEF